MEYPGGFLRGFEQEESVERVLQSVDNVRVCLLVQGFDLGQYLYT